MGIKIAAPVCVILMLAMTMTTLRSSDRARELSIPQFTGSSADNTIPSIVPYVYIKKDVDSIMSFPFASFLTLFASVMYIKPTQIYVHTDYNETEI